MAVPDIVWLVVLDVLAGSLAEVELLVKDALVLVAAVDVLVSLVDGEPEVLVSLVDSEPEVLVT